MRDGELNKEELLFDWFLLFVLLFVNEDTGNEILLLLLLLFVILPFVILFEELTFCLLLLFAELDLLFDCLVLFNAGIEGGNNG